MNDKRVVGLLEKLRGTPKNVRFSELRLVCDHFFGPPRRSPGSHHIYRTSWPGDPRVNIQNDRGKAKAYQVRQVLAAVEKIMKEKGVNDNV